MACIGSTLGGFVVEREIAAGGDCLVYLLRHSEHPQLTRALKRLKTGVDVEAQERLQREGQFLARLRHCTGVVQLEDVGSIDGIAHLELEHIDGVTLAEVLADEGPLPPDRVAQIARQLATTLCMVHASSVVHRDLKPANVMVVGAGTSKERAKLIDFGIAKTFDSQQTKKGTVMGTSGYMAPEVESGREADQRSDVFSFGALLYELLTGADPRLRVGRRVSAERPPYLEPVPPGLEDLIARCLVVARPRRWRMADVLQALTNLAAAEDGRIPVRPPRRGRRSLAVLAGLGAVAVAAAVPGGWYVWEWLTVPATVAELSPPRRPVARDELAMPVGVVVQHAPAERTVRREATSRPKTLAGQRSRAPTRNDDEMVPVDPRYEFDLPVPFGKYTGTRYTDTRYTDKKQ